MPIDKTHLESIIREIIRLFGGKKIELDYETPFQLLCAVILSAQTTDKQVNRITPPLFQIIREPKDVEKLSIDEFESHLKYINFFRNKSRFIKQTGEILARDYNGIIPNDLKILQTFPWVGIKTAKVVLSVLYDMPYVWVDTHIHRVLNRLWVVHTRTPNETDTIIEKGFTTEQKSQFHHPCVLFGRYQCIARSPQCHTCTLTKYCKYYQEKFKKNTQ